MATLLNRIQLSDAAGIIEILVLAFIYYYVILFFRGTRGAQVLLGLMLSMIALLMLTSVFHLDTLSWLFKQFSVYLVVAFVIIFQPEIRRALAELGKQHVFTSGVAERSLIDHIVQACLQLSERKIGALIAVEREIGLRAIKETGAPVDSVVTPELLTSIFFPHAPLHDGGVIIAGDRIVAAGCVFPLSERGEIGKTLGTRHRAAVGLTEETDAIVVIVSEETGAISVAFKGRLSRGVDEERLRRLLSLILLKAPRARSRWTRARDQLNLTPAGVAQAEEDMEKEFESGA